MIRVTVWGENVHEHANDKVNQIYPEGMHAAIAACIADHLGSDAEVRTATLDMPDHGLAADVLNTTDVLTWWGHLAHHAVSDETVEAVCTRVLAGMGLIVLHSGHLSRVFRRLMGTSCNLRWREADDEEVVWTVSPTHPIAEGVQPSFVVPASEMYGEYFDIPAPDELVFISSYSGGEVFRSGCCFRRGKGRIFYFAPGHETYPIYHQSEIKRVIANAVRWAHQAQPSTLDLTASRNSPSGWFRN